jgi:hypothetical protein
LGKQGGLEKYFSRPGTMVAWKRIGRRMRAWFVNDIKVAECLVADGSDQ